MIGFSQGGAASLYTALKYSALELKGLVILSAYLPFSKQYAATYTNQEKKYPLSIFMGHGKEDQVIRYAWGHASSEKLKAFTGFNVTFQSYPHMDHASCVEEQRDVFEFIGQILSKK